MPVEYNLFSPTIDHPDDIQFTEGSTGNVITWSSFDNNPDRFVIYLNETELELELWNGSQINVNVDELSPSIYELITLVYDSAGPSINDTVIVTVYPKSITTSTTITTTPEN